MLSLFVTLQVLVTDRRDLMRERSDRGATAVEYGLMVALIAAVIIFAVGALGIALDVKFSDVAEKIGNAGK